MTIHVDQQPTGERSLQWWLIAINGKLGDSLAAAVQAESAAHAAVRALADMMEVEALSGHGHDMHLRFARGPFEDRDEAIAELDRIPEYGTEPQDDRPGLFDINNSNTW